MVGDAFGVNVTYDEPEDFDGGRVAEWGSPRILSVVEWDEYVVVWGVVRLKIVNVCEIIGPQVKLELDWTAAQK
jgi:hypothetical protein